MALAALLAGLSPLSANAFTAGPSSVTLAGTFQSENGCSSDWDPGCNYTGMSYDVNDDVWQRVLTIPAGSYAYKAALNGTWDENYGARAAQGGDNIALSTAASGAVKFYYDHKTHWATDNIGSTIVTAPGSMQSELGCSGDWDPSCLRSWLQETDDDIVYTLTTMALPAGSYELKAAINESWDVNYGAGGVLNGSNFAFTVQNSYTPVTVRFVDSTNVLSVITSPPPCAAAPFTDVSTSHAFCPEIAWAKAAGVMQGYANGSFQPGAIVTRQAMAAFLTRLVGATPAPCTQQPFTDVPVTHQFCPEIAYAKQRGWTTGFSDGTYRPASSVTRQAMAAFLIRVTAFTPNSCSTMPFTDVATSSTFCSAIQWDKLNGVVSGFADGTYRPAAVVTRQAMAAFLYRVAVIRG